jgi:pimeloyl-ACP methyl ester carboxylesterase
MPLISILRAAFSLLSLVILAVGAYLVWSWWRGNVFVDLNGVERRLRDEEWRLWLGLGLLAWSFLGRFVVLALIAHRDDADSRPGRLRASETMTLPGAGGASLHVQTAGPVDGQPIVLVHGWGLDSSVWCHAERDLAQRFRLILWDLPGLGRSKAGRGRGVSLSDFAADLQAVLGLAEGRRTILVGHSIGGMTIQTLAREHPEAFAAVGGVVLLNTTYTNPLKTMVAGKMAQALRWPVLEPLLRLTIWLEPLARLSAWQSYLSGSAHLANRFGFGGYVTRSQLEYVTRLITRNSQAVQARGNLAMFRWDATGALSDLRVPVLVISGDADVVTKLEASEAIARATPNARLECVRGVNHMGFLERADVYDQAIADFAEAVHGRPIARSALDEPRSFAENTEAERSRAPDPTGSDRPPPAPQPPRPNG